MENGYSYHCAIAVIHVCISLSVNRGKVCKTTTDISQSANIYKAAKVEILSIATTALSTFTYKVVDNEIL